MKNFKNVVIGLSIFGMTSLSGCGVAKIDPGAVGVKVNTVGSERGVSGDMVSPGWVFYNPLTTNIFEYPTINQNIVWTKDKNEGSPDNDEQTFSSSEGTEVRTDTFMSGHFVTGKIPYIVKKYRINSEQYVNTIVRSAMRQAYNEEGAKIPVIGIIGQQKAILAKNVRDNMNRQLSGEYIVEKLDIIHKPRVDISIERAINNSIVATQNAIAAENQKKVVQAQAEQAVIQAQGDKKAIEANPYYLEQMKIQGWIKYGCKVPVVMAPGTTFTDMTSFVSKK